jgi:hypothetical protein
MKSTLIQIAALSSSLLCIGAGSKHKAHQHGVAKIDIAIESKEATSATIEIESPAESIYGFEHEAKSDADKAKIEAANTKLGSEILNMIKFDAALGCSATTTKIDHEIEKQDKKTDAHKGKEKKHHGEHSEVHAEFAVTCQKPIAGTQLSFDFASSFSGLKTVKVQALVGGAQSGVTVKKAGTTLKL